MKLLMYLFIAALMLNTIRAEAQELPAYLLNENYQPEHKFVSQKTYMDFPDKYSKLKHNEILTSAIVRRPYNVLSYDLYLDWYHLLSSIADTGSARYFTGTNTIMVVIDSSNISSIDFDAVDLLMQKIRVNSDTLATTPQPNGNGILTIPLSANIHKGDTVKIGIDYQYVTDYNNGGLFLYPKGMFIEWGPPPYKDSVIIEERIAWTMSEPEDARLWMPCNDAPYDKAKSTITVRAPLGYSVASNGLLRKVDNDDSSATYHWGDTTEIATYLMCATSSKYKVFSDWYHRLNNPNDSIEVKYYVWEKDYKNTIGSVYNPDTLDAYKYNARHAFEHVVDMIKNFSSYLIEYPHVKYGMAAVMNFWPYGGMEHQTITTIDRNWLRDRNRGGGNSYPNNQSGIAHELGHMWLGDLITCATWNDIWINEGGATWCEALYQEKLSGETGYYNYMEDSRLNYYLARGGLGLTRIYGPTMDNLFSTPITYKKASWIYHMLRTMLGDSVYFPALRSMLHRYAYQSVETDDFKNSFKMDVPNPLVPFDTFFDQWVYHAGHPVYEVNTISKNWGSYGYDVTIDLNQVQPETDSIPGVFVAPVVFIIYGPNNQIQKDTVINDSRSQQFSLRLDFPLDSVKIDTSQVLCEMSSSIVSVRENNDKQIIESMVYPNPIVRGMSGNFYYYVSEQKYITVEIYDELGNKVNKVYSGTLPQGNYTIDFSTENISSGTYLLVCRSGDKISSYGFTVY
jgi:aminopeptidase N